MRRLRWAVILILAAVVAGPTWALPNGRPGSTADERQLGALAAEQIIHQHGLVHDDALQTRLDDVGHTLTKFVPSGEDYRFRILKSDDVNALTTPDGEVFVTRALLRAFKADDELAAVLAHEISHVLLGHTARLLTEPDEERRIPVRRRGHTRYRTVTVTSEKKKHWEFEADETGLEVLQAAGYPLQAMERVLVYLTDEEEQDEARHPSSEMDDVTSTHPRSADRLAALRKILRERTAAREPGPPAGGQ
jgi:beta-barrel assembly-enhancing protease